MRKAILFIIIPFLLVIGCTNNATISEKVITPPGDSSDVAASITSVSKQVSSDDHPMGLTTTKSTYLPTVIQPLDSGALYGLGNEKTDYETINQFTLVITQGSMSDDSLYIPASKVKFTTNSGSYYLEYVATNPQPGQWTILGKSPENSDDILEENEGFQISMWPKEDITPKEKVTIEIITEKGPQMTIILINSREKFTYKNPFSYDKFGPDGRSWGSTHTLS